MQELQVRSLFWEASTCHRTTKPRAPRLLNPVPRVRAPQQERQRPREALAPQLEGSPAGPTRESPGTAAGGQPPWVNQRKPGHRSWSAAPLGQPEKAREPQLERSPAGPTRESPGTAAGGQPRQANQREPRRGNRDPVQPKLRKYITKKMSDIYYEVWINLFMLRGNINCLSLTTYWKPQNYGLAFFFHISTFSQQAWISRRLILA